MAKYVDPHVRLPSHIETAAALEHLLTRPRPVLVDFMRTVSSPLLVLGAGGKMGPTLAVLARRAAEAAERTDLEVVAVSRFSSTSAREWLEAQGVRTISADLLDAAAVAALPDAENVIHLVGVKFGTADNPALTWAMNTLVPAQVCQRYPAARIVALSTGNVYPLTPVAEGGAREDHLLEPLGEYANSTIGRERIFEYFSRRSGTRVCLIRLFYALDLRYGVLVDIARKVWNREPLDLANGFFNAIWQGDANEMILRSLDLVDCPPRPINLTRPEILSVRGIALRFGELLDREVTFSGQETTTATLANTERMRELLGTPVTPIENVMRWTAEWVAGGKALLDRPTHFEVRDGRY